MSDNFTTQDASAATVTLAASDDGTAKASKIVSFTVQAGTNFTRPNDSNPYAANDAVNNSTSAPTVMTFTTCARINAGMGMIRDATLCISNKNATVAEFHIWIFDASPAMPNDNAAFAFSDAESKTVQCVLIFTPANYTDSSNNAIYKLSNPNQMFLCAAATKTLYGALMTRTAYTPTAQETYDVELNIIQEI